MEIQEMQSQVLRAWIVFPMYRHEICENRSIVKKYGEWLHGVPITVQARDREDLRRIMRQVAAKLFAAVKPKQGGNVVYHYHAICLG